MKTLLSILLFTFSCSPIFAQKRPMSLAVIEPKFDSIQKEQDILYQYTMANRTATEMASEKFVRKMEASEIIVYQQADTLVAVVAPKDGQKIYEANFVSDYDEISWDTISNRKLSEEEEKMFALKDSILRQSKHKNYNVTMPEGFGLGYTLIPFKGDSYHFYVLSTTEEENLIPFGNAYIFISDGEGNIQSFKKIYPEFNPNSTIGSRGNSKYGIILSYPIEEPFIHAADICNFRIYGVPAGVQNFGVHSIRNKRTTFYDPISNELGFKP